MTEAPATCRRGLHERTPHNTAPDGTCKTCKSETQRQRRQTEREAAKTDARIAAKLRAQQQHTNRQRRQRYLQDDTYREQQQAKARDRWANDPEWRERRQAEHKQRYWTDENFRQDQVEAARHHYATKGRAQRRKRYRVDPEYREYLKAQRQATRQRVKADPTRHELDKERDRIRQERDRRANGVPERNGRRAPGQGRKLPAEPFAAWLGTFSTGPTGVAALTGLSKRHALEFMAGRRRYVYSDTVDRALLHAGTAATLDDLYPPEGA